MNTSIKFGAGLEGKIAGEPRRGAILISHGAGGNMDTALLSKTAEQLSDSGFLTLRWNFSYVSAKRAPSAGGKKEIPEMIEAVNFLVQKYPGVPLILVGKSFGGRVSTYVAANRTDVHGFVFYGLPIQGMGKNPKPRDWSHFATLTGKALFITGEKDKLCPLDGLAEVQAHLTIPFESVVVPGDHSFKPRGEELALETCISWFNREFPPSS